VKYRRFGKIAWNVSEVGYGMWGMVGWADSDPAEVKRALDRSVELGCTFFDTAWGYGKGASETLLGELLKRHRGKKLYAATKIPPKNLKWPSKSWFTLDECFPHDHIIEYTEKSLRNLGVDCIDLQQFHVWEDAWAGLDGWKNAVLKLKEQGKVKHFGVSINRWEPENALHTLETGLLDAVQVIYNIFDQAPEDKLFPLCRKLDIGVIARVPFDEGTLTGTLTKSTTFPPGDWRGTYFVPENLNASVDHAEALKPVIPADMDMAELALRFIFQNPDVHTVIPGMRKVRNVERNIQASDGRRLPEHLYRELRKHRWDRLPTDWSQ
jgi:aryl-alcohol dehydrogenase-like predicted oxidoreductase